MFNSLQEGIILLNKEKIHFMNDLSNKVMNEVTKCKSFMFNRCLDGTYDTVSNFDKKIFFVFENSKNPGLAKQSKNKKGGKKKKGTQSGASGATNSDKSLLIKIDYSLNDIAALSTRELNSKIFTFEKKLASDDLTKMTGDNKNEMNLDNVIKSLSCMRNIDEEFIPSFKFFQFKKSYIRDLEKKTEYVMLCFSDIS